MVNHTPKLNVKAELQNDGNLGTVTKIFSPPPPKQETNKVILQKQVVDLKIAMKGVKYGGGEPIAPPFTHRPEMEKCTSVQATLV